MFCLPIEWLGCIQLSIVVNPKGGVGVLYETKLDGLIVLDPAKDAVPIVFVHVVIIKLPGGPRQLNKQYAQLLTMLTQDAIIG